MGFIIGFAVGWFLCRVLYKNQHKFDSVLMWDNNVLAWRAISPGTRLHPSRRYLGAVEVIPLDENE